MRDVDLEFRSGGVVCLPAANRAGRTAMLVPARDDFRCGAVAADDALALFPGLERCLDTRGGLLPGERQTLSVAVALARRPRMLLAGERALRLRPTIDERLQQQIRAAADRGTAETERPYLAIGVAWDGVPATGGPPS